MWVYVMLTIIYIFKSASISYELKLFNEEKNAERTIWHYEVTLYDNTTARHFCSFHWNKLHLLELQLFLSLFHKGVRKHLLRWIHMDIAYRYVVRKQEVSELCFGTQLIVLLYDRTIHWKKKQTCWTNITKICTSVARIKIMFRIKHDVYILSYHDFLCSSCIIYFWLRNKIFICLNYIIYAC